MIYYKIYSVIIICIIIRKKRYIDKKEKLKYFIYTMLWIIIYIGENKILEFGIIIGR